MMAQTMLKPLSIRILKLGEKCYGSPWNKYRKQKTLTIVVILDYMVKSGQYQPCCVVCGLGCDGLNHVSATFSLERNSEKYDRK